MHAHVHVHAHVACEACSACYPTIYPSIYLSHAQRDTMANLRGLMAKQRELRHVVYMYSHWLGLGLALELGSG